MTHDSSNFHQIKYYICDVASWGKNLYNKNMIICYQILSRIKNENKSVKIIK